jgi:hypothetical protein
MKTALCFIISYEHKLNKEQIWMDWIKPNSDIINVYFHYKEYKQITSDWIKKHAIPSSYICKTDYFHVVPAYISLLKYGLEHDKSNIWFCFLTDSCVPIISPLKFREIFLENYKKTIMSWKPAYWNINFCNRANLKRFNKEFHLANTPWFIINKEDSQFCLKYSIINKNIFDIICNGNIANESIFAIMLYCKNKLKNIINKETMATDWTRMTSPTSPYLFKNGDLEDEKFIIDFLNKNEYTIFLRKVDKSFPDNVLIKYIKEEKKVIEQRRKKIFWLEFRLFYINYLGLFLLFLLFFYIYI